MSIPSRNADPSNIEAGVRTFFVTSSTDGRKALLQSERSARLFIDVLYKYRAEQEFLLHEFVVMPNHFHLLLTVNQISIERAVQLVKGGFAFRAGKDFGFRAPVWQKGFSDSRVFEAAAYRARRTYIHQNPVTRGLARAPEEFPYSSASPDFALAPAPSSLSG